MIIGSENDVQIQIEKFKAKNAYIKKFTQNDTCNEGILDSYAMELAI